MADMETKRRRYEELCAKSELSGDELTERVDLWHEINGRDRVDFSDVEADYIEIDEGGGQGRTDWHLLQSLGEE